MICSLVLAAAPPSPWVEALEIKAQAFGRPVLVVAAGLPAETAEASLHGAVEEIHRVAALTSPDGEGEGGLGNLNAAAGGEAVAVDPHLAELLARSLDFCRWAGGANGPLGGHLFRLWDRAGGRTPTPAELAEAQALAGCQGLEVDAGAGSARLAPGGRIDLRSFAAGYAVDRAVAALTDAGAGTGFVEIGEVVRAFGPGPGGHGWRRELPRFTGMTEPAPAVWLRDRALAIAARPEPAGGEPYLDQRTGRPGAGTVATLAASELAVDAQGLATTMFVTGSRDGQLRLGGLRPRPSVLWLLGSGSGPPLVVDYRWSELAR